MINKAITRKPARSLKNAVRQNKDKVPDYDKALKQHKQYRETLSKNGVDVITLESKEEYPDSVFVEDPAVVLEDTAVICRLGSDKRRGEEKEIRDEISKHVGKMEEIKSPGTIDGGDVLEVDEHVFVGLTDRTNEEGAEQFIKIAEDHGYQAEMYKVEDFLHLKSGISYIGDETLLAVESMCKAPEFKDYECIEMPKGEEYAANSIEVNGKVIIPEGYEDTVKKVSDKGFDVTTVDVSEFRKADGGLSCLSIRL